jgi:hypothetical protein
VQCGQLATWGDFEDRPIVVGPPILSCSIEIPIVPLHESRTGVAPVWAMALHAEAVKCGQLAAGGNLKDSSNAADPACTGCSVPVSVSAQDQPR